MMSSDSHLRAVVVGRLWDAVGSGADRVAVSVFNGVAMLSGDVDTAEMRAEVVRTVREIRSIHGVANALEIIDRCSGLAS
jgi:osmotically-inducible protein OsmY